MNQVKDKLQKKNNSYFILTYNLILEFAISIEPKEELIIKNRIKNIVEDIENSFEIKLNHTEISKNKLHLVFKATPTTNLPKFINSLKTVTSRILKRDFKFLEKKIKSEKLWTNRYFLLSSGEFNFKQAIKDIDSN